MPKHSVRQRLANSAPSLLVNSRGGPEEKALAQCLEWLARNAEYEKLIKRWQRTETMLIRDHDWFRLSEREREGLPEASQLNSVNARIVDLCRQNQKLLARLPKLTATSTDAIAAKLFVALAIVHPDENKEAHQLIRSTLRDLELSARIVEPQ